MALNWTLKSLHFGRHGGQYARAPTSDAALDAIPDFSNFGLAGKANGRSVSRSNLWKYGIALCCFLTCVGAITTAVIVAVRAGDETAAEVTAEAILEELGSGNALSAVVR